MSEHGVPPWTPIPSSVNDRRLMRLRVSPLLSPYLVAMEEVTGWVLDRCWGDNAAVIDAANDLVRERNLVLSGGVSDGGDWEARIAHMSENIARAKRGEPQTDFITGKPLPTTPTETIGEDASRTGTTSL